MVNQNFCILHPKPPDIYGADSRPLNEVPYVFKSQLE